MKLTSKEIDAILQKEINCCLDNPDQELNHDQQMGFMNGLRQAQLLIEKAETAVLLTEPVRPLEIPDRLRPLANIAKDLSEEGIQDCIQYVAYLNYRRRIFKMAEDEKEKLRQAIATYKKE